VAIAARRRSSARLEQHAALREADRERAPRPETGAFETLASRIDSAGLRVVGFTSALLGEGVSTVALGTALALAALRRDDTLLIDANWIEPSLTGDAGLGAAPGLADYLAGHADLADLIRPASSRLLFLPIGDRDAARPALRPLESFMASGASSFATVVVDLPPLLPADPFVMPWAPLLDQLFIVVRERATPLTLVRKAIARLGADARPQIILNRATSA